MVNISTSRDFDSSASGFSFYYKIEFFTLVQSYYRFSTLPGSSPRDLTYFPVLLHLILLSIFPCRNNSPRDKHIPIHLTYILFSHLVKF